MTNGTESDTPQASYLDESPRALPWYVPVAVVAAGVLAFAMYAAWKIEADPDTVMLLPQGEAEWIKTPNETILISLTPSPWIAFFRTEVAVDTPGVAITVTAFRRVMAILDGKQIYAEYVDPVDWKQERRIAIPESVGPGVHGLVLIVINDRGPPAIRARSQELGLATDATWSCSLDGQNWTKAWPASHIATPRIANAFPTPVQQFVEVAPLLLVVCLLAAAFSWRAGTPDTVAFRIASYLTPARVRFAIQAALLGLGIHTMFIANLAIGSDASHHYQHVHWYGDHIGIPGATVGPQHFQAPLFYWIAAALHRVLTVITVDHDTVDRALRIIPVVCGLAVVELMYRMLRRAFPGDRRTQLAGLVAGGFIPLLTYKTHFVSNEPLAAVAGGIAVLAVLRLIDPRHPAGAWAFAACGGILGLAILTKVSATVLAPPIGLALAYWWYTTRPAPLTALKRLGLFVAAFTGVCGWYLALTFARYGKPFIGGWGEEIGFAWWQMPGYRTPEQFYSFGEALVHPVFCAVQGFWDAMYSALWFDSTLSGTAFDINHPKWDYRFAEAALLWALLPTIALAIGGIRALLPPVGDDSPATEHARAARILSIFTVGAFAAAVLAFTLSLPYYAPIKPSYGMAALPSLAVLIALGLEPLTRLRATRMLLHAWLAGWALLVCAGYWVLAP